jgi:hypothetical protein
VQLSWLLDEREGLAEVGRERVFGGEGVMAGADLDGALTAGGPDEFLDGPARAGLDGPGDGKGGKDDTQVASMDSAPPVRPLTAVPAHHYRAQTARRPRPG